MNTTFSSGVTRFIASNLGLKTTLSQDSPQWHLPKGVKARLGKGGLTGNITYSPDGTRFAVASAIGIWIYNAYTNKELKLLTGHTDEVLSVAFSPNGTTLASGSEDETVRLWNIVSGKHEATLTEHTDSVSSVCFSPDGQTLASGSSDETVRLWDVVGRKQKVILARKTGISHFVESVAFSPDGNTLASGGDTTVRLWDTITGHHKATLKGHRGLVLDVAFSPDGSTLVSMDDTREVRLWDTITGHSKTTWADHLRVSSVAFSPDGSPLAIGSLNTYKTSDEMVRLWDITTGHHKTALRGHTGGIVNITCSPDDSALITEHNSDTVKLWSAASGKHKATLTGHTNSVSSIAFSPDGNTLASVACPMVFLWDVTKGHHKTTFKEGLWYEIGRYQKTTVKVPLLAGFYSVAFSPDGNTLATGGFKEVLLWDAATKHQKTILKGHKSCINSVSFSPDGGV